MLLSPHDLPAGVELVLYRDAAQQAHAVASAIAEQLRQALTRRSRATLVLPGGRSPVALMHALSAQDLPWARVDVGLTDERWVPPDHPHSNERLVREHLLRNAAAAARLYGLYTPAPDLERAACAACVLAFSQVDVLVLGMGADGHCASLFPGAAGLEQALDAQGTQAVVSMYAPSEPRARLSLTYPWLSGAAHRWLLVSGGDKHATLRAAVKLGDRLVMPVVALLEPGVVVAAAP